MGRVARTQGARSAPFGVDLRVVIPWVITVSICITFGTLHCLMWHRVFLTVIEQVLWRVASVVATLAVPGYLLVWSSHIPGGLGSVMPLVFLASYAVARLYLIRQPEDAAIWGARGCGVVKVPATLLKGAVELARFERPYSVKHDKILNRNNTKSSTRKVALDKVVSRIITTPFGNGVM